MLSKDSIKFLDDLKKNNNREWFLEQKKRYETYKADYHRLVSGFLEAIKPLDPSLELLEIKHCTFRINRDIRFSKDKSPYKDHMGLWFSSGAKGANRAGYYVHISPTESFIAGGFYSPDNEELKKIRKEIAFFYDELDEILAAEEFKSVFGDLDRENALKTMPKGYEKEHPAIENLKLKSFTASSKFNSNEATQKDFIEKTVAKLIALKPLNDFLNRALTTEDHY